MAETKTKGEVLHFAAAYDVLAWLLLRGQEKEFRARLVKLARIEPGESALDVGCGTGSLALAAKRRAGAGVVEGIDPSPQMVARAKRKAKKAGLELTFRTGVAEALPFSDSRFDAVLSTLMLHHLPDDVRRQFAREIRRVLKPGGRAFVVDFSGGGRFFHRHGGVTPEQIAKLLTEAGLEMAESGLVGVRNLNFVLASRP